MLFLKIHIFLNALHHQISRTPNFSRSKRPRKLLHSIYWRNKVYMLSICKNNTHHRGAWGERRYSSYSFLTSALDGGEWSVPHPSHTLTPGKGPPVPTVQDPRVCLDTEARGKILLPLPGIEPGSPSHPACSQTLYWLSYPAVLIYILSTRVVKICDHTYLIWVASHWPWTITNTSH
jgi:hypothetical protein